MLSAVPLASTGKRERPSVAVAALTPEQPLYVDWRVNLMVRQRRANTGYCPSAVLPPRSRHSASRTTAANNALVLLLHPSMRKGEQNAFTAALRDPVKSPCFLSQYASDS